MSAVGWSSLLHAPGIRAPRQYRPGPPAGRPLSVLYL